jgi:UDP-glucose 4-epimerase
LSELKPDTYYAKSKVEGEKIVLSTKRKVDQEPFCTVLRSTSVYGPNMKGNYRRVIQGVASGWFYPIGKSENRRTLITDHDLARAALLAAKAPEAISEIYNVTDGKIYTLKEIYNAIWRGLKKRPPKFYIPISLVKFTVFVLEKFFNLIGKKAPITINTMNKMVEDRSVDATKIQKELDFKPSIPLEKGWNIAIAGIFEE